MPSDHIPTEEDIDFQLRNEALEEARDTLGSLESLINEFRHDTSNSSEVLGSLITGARSLIGQAPLIGGTLVDLVSHQFMDYLWNLDDFSQVHIQDIQKFIDNFMDILDGKFEGKTEDIGPKLVRELPLKKLGEIDFGDITQKNVQILVICPEKAMSRILEREMAACGYRTITLREPFKSFEMAISTKPDLIIASRELGSISGIDIALAFAAMPKTQRIPFALLSSYGWGHPGLDGLPPRVALLRKGGEFGADLADALARFRIT
ncbi:MAG: DNA-binding response regulator [Rhodospirillales bacterium]|nr:DNA-binding response regulator [Rhodospirillales bacterium]